MSEIDKLNFELAQKNLFIANLIDELSEAYKSIEQIKDEVIALTLDFKHIVEGMRK